MGRPKKNPKFRILVLPFCKQASSSPIMHLSSRNSPSPGRSTDARKTGRSDRPLTIGRLRVGTRAHVCTLAVQLASCRVHYCTCCVTYAYMHMHTARDSISIGSSSSPLPSTRRTWTPRSYVRVSHRHAHGGVHAEPGRHMLRCAPIDPTYCTRVRRSLLCCRPGTASPSNARAVHAERGNRARDNDGPPHRETPPHGVELAGYRVGVDGGDVRSAETNRRVSSTAGPRKISGRRHAGRPGSERTKPPA